MPFPELGPIYYDERDKGMKARMEASYAEAITINLSFWQEADLDTRFECSDQTIYNQLYGNLPTNRRRQFSFNRIRRVINMISGHQRRNRKSIIAVPYENGDAETADQFSKILMWECKQNGILETISESFHGSLVTGMNLMQLWVDYRSDPISGCLRVDNNAYNAFLIDPYFRKPDLSDCNFVWTRKFVTKREVISLLPDYADEVLSLSGNSYSGMGYDGKFPFLPESYNYGMKNLLSYDEYYYRDYRTQKMLADSQTGETMEWKGQDDEKLKLFLQTYPQVTVIEAEVPTTRLAIVVSGKVMYDGPNPLGIDQYPFVPVFSYYNPQLPYFPERVQGVVRGLRDAQYLYNRRKVIELDILESQINSGWIYKESSLVNPKDVFLSGQGRGLALKDEAQMTDVQQIQSPQVPPSTIELSRILGEEISQISGVNEELLGSAIDDKAGILSMLRQGAGLTTLQGLFDNLDYAQKLLGKIMIDVIQANYTPGKIKKILEGEEPTAQFYNKAFGKYHASVEEGLNTTNQKQMQFAQLLQLREVGVPVPDDVILEAATIQDKKKLVDAINAKAQQAEQMQQMQLQAAIEEQQARTELAKSRSIADQGLGAERYSRIDENRALAEERRAAAVKDEEQAMLNLVKALKEIDGIDLEQIHKLIEISNIIKQQEQVNDTLRTAAAKPQTQQSDLRIQV